MPEALYELSATHALRNAADQALEALEASVHLGWADTHQLRQDPCFGPIRDSHGMRQLMARAASLITLPPPVGAGGFPDLGESSLRTRATP